MFTKLLACLAAIIVLPIVALVALTAFVIITDKETWK